MCEPANNFLIPAICLTYKVIIILIRVHDLRYFNRDSKRSNFVAMKDNQNGKEKNIYHHWRSGVRSFRWALQYPPETAFTLPGEFFNERSVDEGVLFGFHRMNAFTAMTPLESIHFHGVEKNADIATDLKRYQDHLTKIFITKTPENEYLLNSHRKK